ncbi:MAG: hypothetical protein CL607_23865, partial [Anaerolineaceae bacterium]|nr:hypothetical protein [Anaerolineaceae bacterium]
MAIGLQVASVFRLWVIARDLTRQANGSGQITLSVLKQALAGFGVRYGRSHFNTLLRNGEGLFWNRDRERLYLHGYQRLSAQLTDLALLQNPDLVAENRPGGYEVYLCPTGSAEQWHAMCYAGWLASRHDPTVSRETLSRLFSRSADTLRKWERDHLQPYLQIRHNYAQCADTAHWPYPNLPAHTGSYAAQTREGVQLRLIWQLPNSYRTRRLRLHRHRGQGRKARRMSNHRLYLMIKAHRKTSSRSLFGFGETGSHRRMYFASARRLKQ